MFLTLNNKNQLAKIFALFLTVLFFTACSDDKVSEIAEDKKPLESETTTILKSSKNTQAIETINSFITEQAVNKMNVNWKQKLKQPPQAVFSEGDIYFWELETNKGRLRIKLMPDVAPMHVSSTIYLTHLGFYDNIIFHRIIPGFMAQGGDPIGLGSGNPGYKYAGEFSPKAVHDKPGILSMANAGPNTDGSQFFITFKATPFLNNKHTVFGEVVSGMETLKVLEQFGSRSGKTSEKLEIVKATIRVE